MENKTFVRHEGCPTCGSKNNRSVYWNEELKGETWYCHSPGCEDKKTDRDLAAERSSIKLDSIPLPASQLSKLGLSAKTASRFDITCRGRKIFFGYRNTKGVLVRAKVRDYEVEKSDPKHFFWLGSAKDSTLYGMSAATTKKALVIVTGEWDAPAASEMLGQWFSVVSVPNGDDGALKYLKANFQWIQTFEKIYLCFDNDEQGQSVVEDCAKLIGERVWTVVLPKYQTQHGTTKDAKDFLQYGLATEFKQAFYGATEYTPAFIVGDDELLSGIQSFLYDASRRTGLSSGIAALDTKVGGFRLGEVSVLMGNPGRGKSSLGRGFLIHLIKQDVPCLYITLEEMGEVVAARIMEIIHGVSLIKSQVTDLPSPAELARMFSPLRGKLILGKVAGALDTVNLTRIIYYAAKTKGVKFVLFDHITAATGGAVKQSEAISNMMSALNQLAQHHLIHIQVISHTHRKESDTEALEEGIDPTPTIRDGFGSSGIEQYAHLFLALQKQVSHTKLHILKNRLWGIDGDPTLTLYFKGGRYTDLKGVKGEATSRQESHSSERGEMRQQIRVGSPDEIPNASPQPDALRRGTEAESTEQEHSVPDGAGSRLAEPVPGDDGELRLADTERPTAGDKGTADAGLPTKDRAIHRATPRRIHETTVALARRRASHPSTFMQAKLPKVGGQPGDSQHDLDGQPSEAMAQLSLMFKKHKPEAAEDEE